MNTFRAILLLTGILVAGLAINTALAQTSDAQPDMQPTVMVRYDIKPKIKHKVHPDKVHKAHLRTELKNLRQKDKRHQHDLKHELKHDRKQNKVKVNKQDRMIKVHKHVGKTKPVKSKPLKTF